jgi:hypothetical protein
MRYRFFLDIFRISVSYLHAIARDQVADRPPSQTNSRSSLDQRSAQFP